MIRIIDNLFRTKSKPSISEPVISFVETVRKYPKRFAVIPAKDYANARYCVFYDKETKLSFKLWITRRWRYGTPSFELKGCCDNTYCLTSAELLYAFNEISAIYRAREETLCEHKNKKNIND